MKTLDLQFWRQRTLTQLADSPDMSSTVAISALFSLNICHNAFLTLAGNICKSWKIIRPLKKSRLWINTFSKEVVFR